MAWFKIDDQFWSHPKVNDLSAAAGWLWVRAGSWSANHLTDGYVSYGTVRMLGTVKLANELVKCGLWVKAEGGYKFHDWDVYQPSGEAVEKLREKRAEAGRLGAARRWRKLADDAAPDGNTDGEPVANAMASAMANAWQNDAPSPSPFPHDSFTSSQSGLVSNAREILDRIDPKKIRAELKSLAVEVTDEELADWAEATLALSPSPVRNPTGYLKTAIRTDANNDGGEIEGWLHNHRRSRIKAVGE